jgi:hypothetical protein
MNKRRTEQMDENRRNIIMNYPSRHPEGEPAINKIEFLAEDPEQYLDGLEHVPDHKNDVGDWCPWSGSRTADGTCPQFCHAADLIVGYDAGDRDLPGDEG